MKIFISWLETSWTNNSMFILPSYLVEDEWGLEKCLRISGFIPGLMDQETGNMPFPTAKGESIVIFMLS